MIPFYSTNYMSNNECAYQGKQCIIITKYIYHYEALHVNVDKSPLGTLRVFLETVERFNYTKTGLETFFDNVKYSVQLLPRMSG